MLRKMTIACVIALFTCGLTIPTAVSGEVIGDCVLTGYTFMGGGSAYTSTPEGPNAKDYLLASALNYTFGEANYYGYGWAKFDTLSTETVDSAYLVFDILGTGAMSVSPATPTNPAYLDIYSAGNTDVSTLSDAPTVRDAFRDDLDAATPLYSMTMTSNGTYSVDITTIYNGWVTGSIDNNGLAFAAFDEMSGTQIAGFGNASGAAPYISTAAASVPEPSSLLLLCSVGLGAMLLRRRR